jgi:hypothetical protein
MSRINLLSILLISVLFASISFAQETGQVEYQKFTEQEKVEMAIKNYKNALESDNLGMIESAIINVMRLKYNYPDYDYSSLLQPLASLEDNDKSESVKFMSFIVKNYLEHPERYAWIEKAKLQFDKDMYAVIAQKVAEQIEK